MESGLAGLHAAFPTQGHLLTGNTPVVRGNLIDDDHGCRRVLAENILEQIGYALDELGLLLGGDPFPRHSDIDIGHDSSTFRIYTAEYPILHASPAD